MSPTSRSLWDNFSDSTEHHDELETVKPVQLPQPLTKLRFESITFLPLGQGREQAGSKTYKINTTTEHSLLLQTQTLEPSDVRLVPELSHCNY